MQYTRTLDSWAFDARTLEGEEFIVYTLGPGTKWGHRLSEAEAGRLLYRFNIAAMPIRIRAAGENWRVLDHRDVNERAEPTVAGPYEVDVCVVLEPTAGVVFPRGKYINELVGQTAAIDATEAAALGLVDGRSGPPPANPGQDLDDREQAALAALEAFVEDAAPRYADDDPLRTEAESAIRHFRGY